MIANAVDEIKNQLKIGFARLGISPSEIEEKIDEKLFQVIQKILNEVRRGNYEIHFSPMEFLCLIKDLPFIEYCVKILKGNVREACSIRLLEKCWAKVSFQKLLRRKGGMGRRPRRCKKCGYFDPSPKADKCPNCDEPH